MGKRKSKKNKKNAILSIVVLIILIVAIIVGYFFKDQIIEFINTLLYYEEAPKDDDADKTPSTTPELPPIVTGSGELSFHFMELGNHNAGDCIYVKCGDVDILIDAGSRNNSATSIINYVDQYVQDGKLEYVIATHADQDHIAAFSSTASRQGIFEYYQVETIIDFPLTGKNTETYQKYIQYRDAEVEGGATHWTALECYNNENGAQRVIELSEDVEMEILYNYYYEHTTNDENDYSVCLMFNQGENHYLFTGDLEEDGESRLVDYYDSINDPLPRCVLYKAGHHGSKTSSTTKLLEKIRPQYVAVCCCAGVAEYTDEKANQFPTQDFIDRIAPYTNKVYIPTVVDNYEEKTVKSMNGNIVFCVGENGMEVLCSNDDTILKDTDWFKENRTMPSAWITA